jgi:hypothetical protein
MATFGGLFDFPDYGLSNDQSELSSLPDSNNESTYSKRTKDSSDEWYNMPSDSDDFDDDTPALTFTLLLRLTDASSFTSTTFTMSKVVKKEHTTGARIRAIYMLNKKQPWARITAVTGILKSRVYALAAVARERE